ncbi:MAG: DUF1318 domain-containing protein [Leptospiraceae bacterium]|nr:DUF1318 domain-containing protein [Leptospiraceae bacterium]
MIKLTIFLFISLYFFNCFSELRPPPITFTQTQTAFEKQMIGEEKELEKDGWLIASIKTSSSGTEEWKREGFEEEGNEESIKEIISLQRGIAYTSSEIRKLKIDGVLGEGLDGYLNKINFIQEINQEKYNSQESKKRVDELIKIVNEYRKRLREIRIENSKKKLSEQELSEYKKNLQLEYYSSVISGEYFEKAKGKWEKKE